MQIFKQGNQYKGDNNPLDDDEEDVLLESKSSSQLINPKVAIAVGIVIILAIAAVILVPKLSGMKMDSAESGTVVDVADSVQQGITYTPEEIEMLRNAGYTGTEIEEFEEVGKDAYTLCEEAEEARKEVLKQTYLELADGATEVGSEAFNRLRDLTWLAGEPRNWTNQISDSYTEEVIKYNASFIKVPPRGNQLFIKLFLEDGTALFYNVTPAQYARVESEGNMVINYTVQTYNGERFVTRVEEVPI